jgi:hypothetical protein
VERSHPDKEHHKQALNAPGLRLGALLHLDELPQKRWRGRRRRQRKEVGGH